jgi:hypothetical protein
MSKWTQVGSIRLSKDNKLYIKFHANKEKDDSYSSANLKELAKALESAGQDGIALQIEKPADKINKLAGLGFIKEEDLEKRLAQIPEWLKYEITLPPQND